jgi:hypothetical protein
MISLDQSAYCERVLKRFDMLDANPVRTPLTQRLTKSDDLDDSNFEYRGGIFV